MDFIFCETMDEVLDQALTRPPAGTFTVVESPGDGDA
jgi:hypothetical protein